MVWWSGGPIPYDYIVDWWSGGLVVWWSGGLAADANTQKKNSCARQSLVHQKHFFRDPKFSAQKKLFRDLKFSALKKIGKVIKSDGIA